MKQCKNNCDPGHMTKMVALPILAKKLSKNLLRNQRINNPGPLYLALWICVLKCMLGKVDLDLLYAFLVTDHKGITSNI